tara:strand:- start:549 stop:674 length:126 start_codon:yes stop_codon:yes gene_type:complete
MNRNILCATNVVVRVVRYVTLVGSAPWKNMVFVTSVRWVGN